MRIYIPATTDEITADLLKTRGVAIRRVHAVTPGLTGDYPDFDSEELEDVAQYIASLDSLPMIASRPEAERRRVYLAAEVPEEILTSHKDGLEPDFASELWLTEPVTWEQIVCGFVDEGEATPVVEEVLAGERDPSALDSHDLLWFDLTEFETLP